MSVDTIRRSKDTGVSRGGLEIAARAPATPLETKLCMVNLRTWFGSREVLHGITGGIQANRITALIGPTGCGKSTLLRTLNRLNDETPGFRLSGDVLFDRRNIYRDIADVRDYRRRVGMVFQRPNPFPQTIFDNVAIGIRVHGIVPAAQVAATVEEQLREVGLWAGVKDKLRSSPFGLSGGQQQLLCIARTLAVRPEVVLLDEPTSSLDPDSTERVEDLLLRLRERMTVMAVTHNLPQAARIADQVMFLYDGSLVEAGERQQLFAHPKDPRTEAYVAGRMG